MRGRRHTSPSQPSRQSSSGAPSSTRDCWAHCAQFERHLSECRRAGCEVCSHACRLPLPGTLQVNTLQSCTEDCDGGGIPEQTVTKSQIAVKKVGGWGRGHTTCLVVTYYLFAQATKAEAISCPSNWGQRANVFSRHSSS